MKIVKVGKMLSVRIRVVLDTVLKANINPLIPS